MSKRYECYTKYTCECGEAAAPQSKSAIRKNGTLAPRVSTLTKKPCCAQCLNNGIAKKGGHGDTYSEYQKEKMLKIKTENYLGFIADITYGPGVIKDIKDLYCLKSGRSLYKEDYGNIRFGGQEHHINVLYGNSVGKMVNTNKNSNENKVQPSTLVTKTILSTNNDGMIEILRCSCMDDTTHGDQHALGGPNQGYEMYAKHQLNWMVREEENFNYIIKKYNIKINMTYREFIKSLTNDKVPKELYHPDRLILPEEVDWIDKHKAGRIFGGIAGNSFKQYFYLDRYKPYIDDIRVNYNKKKLFCKSDVEKAYKSLCV